MFSARYHAVAHISLTAHGLLAKAIDLGQGAPTVTSPSEKGGVNHWESAGLFLAALVVSCISRA